MPTPLLCCHRARTADLPVSVQRASVHAKAPQTSPGWPNACDGASARIALRPTDSVGTQIAVYFAAQWLAYTLPYRRFADFLADACARLGADADRYSFIAVDLHHLLLAGNSPGAPVEKLGSASSSAQRSENRPSGTNLRIDDRDLGNG